MEKGDANMLMLSQEESAELERAVRWVSRSFRPSEEDLADLAQDAFLKLLEQAEPPACQAARAAWVRKTARNRLIDRHRHDRRFQKVELDESGFTAPVRNAEDDELEFTDDTTGERRCIAPCELKQLVSSAIEGIADASRKEVARLWFCEGHCIKEISRATGLGASTISSHVLRIKKTLRRSIGAHAA